MDSEEQGLTPRTTMEQEVQKLLESQGLGVLATSGPHGAHASLVAFAASRDLGSLILATPMTTRKYANLEHDPMVALLVDNRSNQRSDCHAALAATGYGRAGAVQGQQRRAWLELYLEKHPHLVDFVQAPSCALVVISVVRYSVVRAFQQVSELVLSP